MIPGLSEITSASVGVYLSLFLRAVGTTYCAGYNYFGFAATRNTEGTCYCAYKLDVSKKLHQTACAGSGMRSGAWVGQMYPLAKLNGKRLHFDPRDRAHGEIMWNPSNKNAILVYRVGFDPFAQGHIRPYDLRLVGQWLKKQYSSIATPFCEKEGGSCPSRGKGMPTLHSCGPEYCAESTSTCSQKVADMVIAPMALVANIATFGAAGKAKAATMMSGRSVSMAQTGRTLTRVTSTTSKLGTACSRVKQLEGKLKKFYEVNSRTQLATEMFKSGGKYYGYAYVGGVRIEHQSIPMHACNA